MNRERRELLEPLELAYSPCPNDTFIFTPWVEGRIPNAPPVVERYEDIDTLNQLALRGEPDIVKVSFHALGHLRDNYYLLRSGGALGLVLASWRRLPRVGGGDSGGARPSPPPRSLGRAPYAALSVRHGSLPRSAAVEHDLARRVGGAGPGHGDQPHPLDDRVSGRRRRDHGRGGRPAAPRPGAPASRAGAGGCDGRAGRRRRQKRY